jgi:N-acetylglutamate synthase/N-acetylornithine aminotransferase
LVIAGVYAALRAAGKKADLSLVVADEPAVAGGVFTKNVMCAAPVLYCKDVLGRTQKVKAVSLNKHCKHMHVLPQHALLTAPLLSGVQGRHILYWCLN